MIQTVELKRKALPQTICYAKVVARVKIKQEFRSKFSEKLMDLGNLVAAALVFGQFISGNEFLWITFASGMLLATLCYTISYLISS